MDNEYMRTYMANRRSNRRTKLINMLGSMCINCDSVEDLQIDHIDPSKKLFTLSGAGLDRSWKVILSEVAKCQLLCLSCHAEKTAVDQFARCEHGTEHMYLKYKCRCNECVNGFSEVRKNYPSRRKRSPVV